MDDLLTGLENHTSELKHYADAVFRTSAEAWYKTMKSPRSEYLGELTSFLEPHSYWRPAARVPDRAGR
jgi:hypothetical protein